MRVVTTTGFRLHFIERETCWCAPYVEQVTCEGCGEVHTLTVHGDVTVSQDKQPRMTVFSSY